MSPTTIHYEVTIDDPKIYTRPWKLAIPLERNDAYNWAPDFMKRRGPSFLSVRW